MPARSRPPSAREPAASYTATEAKNRFGQILDAVSHGGAALVTNRKRPRAVILAYDDYLRLVEEGARRLDLLTAEFEALYASQQTPAAAAGMKRAFAATPKRMGKVAVAAARKAR
jgi:prevent-host-death family protein